MRTLVVPWLIAVGVLSLFLWRASSTTTSLGADSASPAVVSTTTTPPKSIPLVRETIRIEHPEGVFSVDLSLNGEVIAAGGQDGSLQLRNAKTGSLMFNLQGHEGDIVQVQFDHHGNKLASVAFDGIRIWRVSDGSLERLLPTKRGAITWFVFTPDGSALISGGPLRDIPVQVWETSTGRELASFPQESEGSKCGAISPDGRMLATNHRDSQNTDTINLWEIEDRKHSASVCLHQDQTKTLAFAADGRHLITADQGGELVVWDPLSGGCYSARFSQQIGGITALAVSRDGSLLVSASRRDKFVRVWELATRQELARFVGHSSVVKGIALSPDGQVAISGGFDSQVMTWNTLPSDPNTRKMDSMDLDQIKPILAGDNALAAQQLINHLSVHPEHGCRIAEQIVQPLTQAQIDSLRHSIHELSNSEFPCRQAAIIELKGYGDLAEPILRHARKAPISLTALQRIDAILEEIHDQPCSSVKASNLRSIQLLQRIGNPDSIQVLTKLARGPEIDQCTLAAREALINLGIASKAIVNQPETHTSRNSEKPTATLASTPSRETSSSTRLTDDSAMELACEIDREIEASWNKAAIIAAPPANDFEWIRRVTLDLTGQIPRAFEVEDFADDISPNKKSMMINRLMESEGHLRYQVETWRELFLGPPLREGLFARAHAYGSAMEQWLTTRFQQNLGLDVIVHELLTTPLLDETNESIRKKFEREPHPFGYYLRQDDLSPSVLGSECSRMFLGIRLECAQCHDHPFAQWSQDQFWGFAAFYSGVRSKTRAAAGMTTLLGEDCGSASIKIPDTDRVIPVRFLDGTTPTPSPQRSTRESLADWITSADNPYFARTMVNRIWAQFFGQGLAEPLDDINVGTSNTHDAVINLLARRFQEKKFDLKYLTRAILLTQAYQRTSRLTHDSQKASQLLAKMPVRSLSGRQLHDSLVRAAGFAPFAVTPRDERQYYQFFNPHRLDLVRRAYSDTPKSETEKSMLDALHQMNGEFMKLLIQPRRDETLDVVTRITGASNSEKIASLYLCALSRKPRSDEIKNIEELLNHQSGINSQDFSFSDVLWAILNSAEFNSNH